jgi:hypothetical protein
MLLTTNTPLTIPTLPGRLYQCSGLGTWGGATVTLQSYVDGAYRPLPQGSFTEDFEIVRVNNGGTELRAAVTGATATTAISVTLSEVSDS